MKREVTSIPFISFITVSTASAYIGHYLITEIGEIWTIMVICLISLAFHGCVVFVCKKDITIDKIIDRIYDLIPQPQPRRKHRRKFKK